MDSRLLARAGLIAVARFPAAGKELVSKLSTLNYTLSTFFEAPPWTRLPARPSRHPVRQSLGDGGSLRRQRRVAGCVPGDVQCQIDTPKPFLTLPMKPESNPRCLRYLTHSGVSSQTICMTRAALSEFYQTVADLDADLPSAKTLAETYRTWTVAQDIIVSTQTDCVLGRQLGHAPGKSYTLAAKAANPLLLQFPRNGVAFITKRSVFYSVGLGPTILACSTCSRRFSAGDSWSAAVENWYKENGPGLLSCPQCGASAPITDWQHDPPWAFGNFGVQFWNWPPLREDFLKALSDLSGHRLRLVSGRF